MKLTAKNDDGVSPVIGTILLVAITVVLVAIVAAVVMGMVGGVSNTKDVGVTVQSYANDSDNGVTVLVYGGNDASKLTDMNVNVEGKGILANNHFDSSNPQVGVPYTYSTGGDADLTNVLVVVTGNFTDGQTSVLAQSSLTIPKRTGTTP